MTEQDLRPPKQQRMREQTSSNGTTKWLLIVLAIAAAGYAAWYAREYWAAKSRAATPALEAPISTPAAPAAPVVPEPAAAQPSAPLPASQDAAPQHPLPATTADAIPADDAQALDRMAKDWLGSRALKFLVMPGLAHHIVATIDNLPRGHAAPRLWPVYPVGGQMQLTQGTQGMHIASTNSARYDAVVGFVTSIEPAQAAAWYRQAYPLLQQTYEGLGYPGQYFNDRLVAVIDHLLQTPELQEPIAVQLVQVQGQVPSQQPWLRYEYADPKLQSLSSGQKILLRLGATHRQRIQTYLQALRAQIAA